MLLCHSADILAHCGVSRRQLFQTIRGFKLLLDRLHQLLLLRSIRSSAQERPALRVNKNPPLLILADAEYHIIIGDAPGIPAAIPQVSVDDHICLFRCCGELLAHVRPSACAADVRPD
ncbi:hypothetical protein D3C75_642700 [compost metagenome]